MTKFPFIHFLAAVLISGWMMRADFYGHTFGHAMRKAMFGSQRGPSYYNHK